MEEKEKVSSKKTSNEAKAIPGPRGWPVIGNLTQLDSKNVQMTFYNWKLEYGPVFQFSILGHKFVVLNDAEMFKTIFENDSMQNRPEHTFYRNFNFNGRGLTFSNFGEQDCIVKEIGRKIFHEVQLDDHLQKLKLEEMDNLVKRLSTGEDVDLGTILLSSIAKQFTIEMLGSEPTDSQLSVVLENMNGIIGVFSGGRESLLSMLPWVQYIPGSTKNAVLRLTTAKECLMKEVISVAVSSYVEGEEHGIIHRFLTEQKHQNDKAGKKVVEDEQVGAIVLDIIGGAFASTSRNLIHCFFALLHHPEVYERVKDEIAKVSSGKNAEENTYLQAFVMECIRFASIVHVTVPHAVVADTTIAGYRFEKGMTIIGNMWNVHHDENTWGDPWTLRPERFLDDEGILHPQSHSARCAFMPFSTGPRYCKGKDLAMSKIFQTLSNVLLRCDMHPPIDSTKLPENDPRKYESVVSLGLPTFYCRFTRKQ